MNAQLSLLTAGPLDAWAGIQPRYRAYARANGSASAERQLERDRERYPGGAMVGFITWIGERWVEWRALTGRRSPHSLADHAAFDAWLATHQEERGA
jgi:hypothetical protein